VTSPYSHGLLGTYLWIWVRLDSLHPLQAMTLGGFATAKNFDAKYFDPKKETSMLGPIPRAHGAGLSFPRHAPKWPIL
jgi:hypothetical protein